MNLSIFFILFISPVLAYEEGENIATYENSPLFSGMPGGWEDEPVYEILKNESMFGAKQISYRINSRFHYKLINIIEGQRQVVAGLNYRIKISIQETVCPKSFMSFEAAQICEVNEEKKIKHCRVLIYYIPWESKRQLTDFNCSDSETFQEEMMRSKVFLQYKLLFKKFMHEYKKTYRSIHEKNYRFSIFLANLRKIYQLNLNERGTAAYGITKYSDLNEMEYHNLLGFRPDMAQNSFSKEDFIPYQTEVPSFPIPSSFDWRKHNAVTEVKNQKLCGSCWAFSTTGNIEGLWAIKKKQLLSLSEQELVDCDKVDQGCNGGLPSQAYHEIIRLGGLETEEEYPYEAKTENCKFKRSAVRVYINSSVVIAKNETEMAAWLVKNGPISAGINAQAMQFYRGGISHPSYKYCVPYFFNLNHGVVIVGYGEQSFPLLGVTLPFWIIKNSWGADWGEKGYYRLYRGDGSCGINQFPTSAIID